MNQKDRLMGGPDHSSPPWEAHLLLSPVWIFGTWRHRDPLELPAHHCQFDVSRGFFKECVYRQFVFINYFYFLCHFLNAYRMAFFQHYGVYSCLLSPIWALLTCCICAITSPCRLMLDSWDMNRYIEKYYDRAIHVCHLYGTGNLNKLHRLALTVLG